ncbi:MAG TPA: VWA domain-containing protein [Kofleriaceae bacterium]|jgi:Ca-activated chloride channel family protein
MPKPPFLLTGACEAKNVEPGTSSLWASIKVQPQGKGMETDRAPLAIALVIDHSGSMSGSPLAHVVKSCELLADLLGEGDEMSIVPFSQNAAVLCGLTAMSTDGKTRLKSSLKNIRADGGTNIQQGIAVAAGVLMTARAGLRRVMVVMSDGQPNIGERTPSGLGEMVRGLGLAVSSLGFGLHHDENVLDAIATAGSGRYAYIPDPIAARLDLARAALAHGGIVADKLELRLNPADGVEILQILPTATLRHGKHGVAASIGDIFVDEGRQIAVELKLNLKPGASGTLVEISVEGSTPNGHVHTETAKLVVDVRSGARVMDLDAQREIIMVQADHARAAARAHADRGQMPSAAALLRQLAAKIDGLPGFVRNDGSMLAELREQLEDEAANFERNATVEERLHQRKQSMMYKAQTPFFQKAMAAPAPVDAQLLGIGGPVAGKHFPLLTENIIGRSSNVVVHVDSANLSREHARVAWMVDGFILTDLGSTNGSRVNGTFVTSVVLREGDLLELGDAVFRFQLRK